MKNKIKLFLPNQHSSGRGIGYYTENLISAYKDIDQIELTSKNPNIIHYPFFDLFYPSLPLAKRMPTVVTIHDVTPLVLSDLYPQGLRGRFSLQLQKLSLKSVSAILTDSNNSKEDIQKYLSVSPDKIHVTPLAVDPIYQKSVSQDKLEKIKQKYQLPENFVLYVGGVNPNKNIPSLIEACQSLGVNLVLVGSEFTKPARQTFSIKSKLGFQKTHPELKQLSLIKQKIKQDASIQALGFVPTAELSAIYRLASLYCQPSLYEGFGLPLLEAMTAECLVVSSNTSSLPEIYPPRVPNFNPQSIQSMKKTIKQALQLNEEQKKDIIKQAKKRADEFSWSKTANKTFQIYNKLLAL